MRLCLSCRFVSPAGALRCGRCGRSFGGRLCPRHHLSPAGSQFCVECGRQDLTEAALFLPLGWVSRLVAWGLVLAVVSLLAHHTGGVAGLLWRVTSWGLIHLLDICPCGLMRALFRLAAWLLALLLLSWCLPREMGQPVRALLFRSLHGSGHFLYRATHALFGGLHRWVEGEKGADKKAGKKKKKA